MRAKILSQILILLVAVTALNSCKEKSKPEEPVYKMSAIVGGFKWYQNTVTCTLLIDSAHSSRIIDIRASSGGKTLTMEFINPGIATTINTGTYSHPGSAYFLYDTDGSTTYNTQSGFVTISGVNATSGTISGNFDYLVQDASGSSQVHITNGKLVNVAYTVVYR